MSNPALRWVLARRAARGSGWRGTDALLRAAACGFALVAAGAVLHRMDLLLIGAPLLLSVLVTVPPSGSPTVRTRPLPRTTEPGRSGWLEVLIDPGSDVELTALRMPMPDSEGTRGAGPVHLLPGSATAVRTRTRWDSWGEGVNLRPDHLFAGADGLHLFGPVVGPESRRVVLPPIEPLPPGPLPPRAAGMVGVHRSPRPGDGSEPRDIRPFRAGDRLRRVDWRVSLRSAAAAGGMLVPGTLYVRERHAEADADLVLALDTTIDVGPDMGAWSYAMPGSGVRTGGSLDAGVRAASSLAAGYLRQGDRVALIDLGRPALSLSSGAGRRQLDRIRHQLVVCAGRASGSGVRPAALPLRVPHGSVVVVLSPFLDDTLVELTVQATRSGNVVLAVDLLPDPLVPDKDTEWGPAVRQVLVAEHRVRLDAMRWNGVYVVRYDEVGSIGVMLRAARRRVRAIR